MPAQGAPAPEGGGAGGGIGDVLQDVDGKLSKIAQMTGQSSIPDEAKAAFAQASEAFRAGLEIVMQLAEGGGGQPAPQGGTVSPEQGGSQGAVPMSHGAR